MHAKDAVVWADDRAATIQADAVWRVVTHTHTGNDISPDTLSNAAQCPADQYGLLIIQRFTPMADSPNSAVTGTWSNGRNWSTCAEP